LYSISLYSIPFAVPIKRNGGKLLFSFVEADEGGGAARACLGTGAATRCLLTHPPDAISIASALKEIYEDIYVSECVSGPPCGSVVHMGLYGL
jgi:hypothetical protein